MAEKFTITGYSTALFSTWILVEQLGLLLDAGDGVCAGLLQKSRKARKVAITHPDRDHVTGLLQLQQLNAADGVPEVFYPADCGSFPALAEFCRRFDPGRGEAVTWTPVKPGDEMPLDGAYQLRVMANDHFDDQPGLLKSLSYSVVRRVRKLKTEFQGVVQDQLAELSRKHGSEYLTDTLTERVLDYVGDAGVAEAARWAGCQILIHEATFLTVDDAGDRTGRHKHSVLPEVLQMAVEARPGKLILNHFSSRYSGEEVLKAIRGDAARLGVSCPVYAILPGEIARDILNGPPVWAGNIGHNGDS